MIKIKSKEQIEAMKHAGEISARALALGASLVKPGATTNEINRQVHAYILSQNAKPSFLGLYDFPASVCTSVNDVIIHGFPDDRPLLEGDAVSLDVGAYIDGFHGDNAGTFIAGKGSPDVVSFLETTFESLQAGVKAAVVGNRVGDISNAVEAVLRAKGYGVVDGYVGHGVGSEIHEDPSVPNLGRAGFGPRLEVGMAIAIEPMSIMVGEDWDFDTKPDGQVLTTTGAVAAHFEHTIAITEEGPLVLTPVYYSL